MRRAAAISGVLTLTLGIASIGVHLTLSGQWQSLWHETAVTAIAPEQGYAFTAPTGHPELSAHQRPSPATVLENGAPLGPSNAQHADIRDLGRGRLSFWDQYVYFSSSDLSDPRSNGRRYTIRYPPIDYASASVLYFLTAVSLLCFSTAVSLLYLSTAVRLLHFFATASFAVVARIWFKLLSLTCYWLASLAAFATRSHPVASLALIFAGLVLAIVLWRRGESDRASRDDSAEPPRLRVRVSITAVVFVTAIGIGYLAQLGLSTPIAPDTVSYWATPWDFMHPKPGVLPLRTPEYSLLLVMVQLLGGSGRALLFIHYGMRAIAAAAVAWMLGARSAIAAGVIGGLLALDPVGAAFSVWYLSESVSASGLVLATVLAVTQLSRAGDVKRGWLVGAGILFGLACLVRPTWAALILVVIPAYALATASVSRAAYVALGYAVAAVSLALLNYVRTGLFVIVTTGYYVAFPLFIHHLMDPTNGPASRRIYAELKICHPTLDYSAVVLDNSNEFVHTKLLGCTLTFEGGDRAAAYRLYVRAYREAFFARPFVFTWRIALESTRFLSTTVSYYPAEVASFSQIVNDGICARRGDYPPTLMAFVCPMPPAHETVRAWMSWLGFPLRMLYQPYLYAYHPRLVVYEYIQSESPELAGIAAILFFVFATASARPGYRAMMTASALIIVYTAAATAFGQVTMLRYVAPLSSFFLIITGLFAVTLIEEALEAIRQMRSAMVQAIDPASVANS